MDGRGYRPPTSWAHTGRVGVVSQDDVAKVTLYANDTTESDSDNDEAGAPAAPGPSAGPAVSPVSSADSHPTCLLCALPIDGADVHLVPDSMTRVRQPVHDSSVMDA